MNKRPERDLVEKAYIENSRRKAHDIAEEAGLIETMGYDKAVSYVRSIKKAMKKKGQIAPGNYSTDGERLRDIQTLLERRKGKKQKRNVASLLLLLNCYYQLRSEDDDIHLRAIDDTYERNRELAEPFTINDAIQICGAALAQYMNSKDEAMTEAARKKGYPGAGLNYTDESFIEKLEITQEELESLTSIKKGASQ